MEEVPYDVIAKCFKNRSVVPFLGAAASFTGADETIALPGGRALARMFAQRYRYPGSLSDPLTKITQYVEEIPADRDFLLNEIESIFCTGLSADCSCSLTAFFVLFPSKTSLNL